MNDLALIDTGFWIALADPSDPGHVQANRNADFVELSNILVPWPIVYETLRTRFVRRPAWIARLDHRLKKPNTRFIDDLPYRRRAYDFAVDFSLRQNRPISMVDVLCRLLIEDPNLKRGCVVTMNPKNFIDVCRKHRVEIL